MAKSLRLERRDAVAAPFFGLVGAEFYAGARRDGFLKRVVDVVERRDRFDEEGTDVEGFGFLHNLASVHRSEDDDGDGGEPVVGVKDLEKLVAVHFGEGEIEENDIRGAADRHDQGFAAGGRGVHVIAGELEHARNGLAGVGVVLDIQHSGHESSLAAVGKMRQRVKSSSGRGIFPEFLNNSNDGAA